MQSSETLLRTIGELIRSRRAAAGLTQEAVGNRAGLSGKYVSEIERGTRDMPISTLLAIVEGGLGLDLDIRLGAKPGSKTRLRPALPRPVADIADAIAELPPEQRGRVLAAIRSILALAVSK